MMALGDREAAECFIVEIRRAMGSLFAADMIAARQARLQQLKLRIFSKNLINRKVPSSGITEPVWPNMSVPPITGNRPTKRCKMADPVDRGWQLIITAIVKQIERQVFVAVRFLKPVRQVQRIGRENKIVLDAKIVGTTFGEGPIDRFKWISTNAQTFCVKPQESRNEIYSGAERCHFSVSGFDTHEERIPAEIVSAKRLQACAQVVWAVESGQRDSFHSVQSSEPFPRVNLGSDRGKMARAQPGRT
jgi:hypothetical protein